MSGNFFINSVYCTACYLLGSLCYGLEVEALTRFNKQPGMETDGLVQVGEVNIM